MCRSYHHREACLSCAETEFTCLCACALSTLLRDTAADISTELRRAAMRSPVISVTLQIFAERLPQEM